MSAPFNDRAPFAVGEVCLLQNCRKHFSNNGREVTITAIGMLAHDGISAAQFGYRLDFTLPNGATCVALPSQLRRRKPPAADSNERMHMQLWRDMAGKVVQREGEAA
jgi:hypothetical protein